MSACRHLVVVLLLLLVPFQTIASGTGVACALGGHHGAGPEVPGRASIEKEDCHGAIRGQANALHHAGEHDGGHGMDGVITHAGQAGDAFALADAHAGMHCAHAGAATADLDPDASEKCRFCMECCASPTPLSARAETGPAPAHLIRVPLLSPAVHASGTLSGVFRPPRDTLA